MRVIVLAAGQGYQLDGFNKLLINDPRDGSTVIDKYIRAFEGMQITVVVGYRAINVMNRYRHLDYVFNPNWAVSDNSYSLSLAISEEPCYVIFDDLFIEPELIEMLEKAGPDLVLTAKRENRLPNTLNCSLDETNRILEVYPGKLKSLSDPETLGLYKISDLELLIGWKRNCVQYPNLFIGQNIPLDAATPIYSADLGSHRLDEVNTPLDYIRLLQEHCPSSAFAGKPRNRR